MVHYIEEELAIRLPQHAILSTPVTLDAAKFYAHEAMEAKNKVNRMAAEIDQNQKKIKFAYDLIKEINNLTAEEGTLSKRPELLEKLLVANELGINIELDPASEENPLAKSTFSNNERERLLQNINLSTDEWDKEVKKLQQKMQMHLDESNRYLTLATQCMKTEKRSGDLCIQGIK